MGLSFLVARHFENHCWKANTKYNLCNLRNLSPARCERYFPGDLRLHIKMFACGNKQVLISVYLYLPVADSFNVISLDQDSSPNYMPSEDPSS